MASFDPLRTPPVVGGTDGPAVSPLPPYRPPRPLPDVVEYLGDFGMSLADVTPQQLAMFVAARNATHSVERLEIPVAPRAEEASGTSLAERQTEEILERTAHDAGYQNVRIPADQMDVGTISGLQDLPRVFPTQWLLEDVQPAMFYKMLADQELLMPVWQQPTEGWQDSYDWTHHRDLVEDRAEPTAAKQHAYVLLDVSRTMNDRDRRGTVARGLALAFLRHGYRTRSQLNLRPFTDEVGELSSGFGRPGLGQLCQRVLELPNAGQTRIQTALEQAVQDIRRDGPCHRADIMLISDGISRLSNNPLDDEALHTFILGNVFDSRGETGTVATLKEWSRSLHRVWNRRFAELLAPSWADVQTANRTLQAALKQHQADASSVLAETLRRLHDNAKSLLREWKRTLAKGEALPPEARALEDELSATERGLPRATGDDTAGKRTSRWKRRLTFSGGGDPAEAALRRRGLGLWALARRLLQGVWHLVRTAWRRLFRR